MVFFIFCNYHSTSSRQLFMVIEAESHLKVKQVSLGSKYVVIAHVTLYDTFRFILERAFLFCTQSKKYISSEI